MRKLFAIVVLLIIGAVFLADYPANQISDFGRGLLDYQPQLSPVVVGTGAMVNLYTYTILPNTLSPMGTRFGKCAEATVVFKHSTGSTSTSYQWAFTSNSITTTNSAGSGTGAGVSNSTLLICFDPNDTVNFQMSNFDNFIGASPQAPVFNRVTTGDSTASQTLTFQFNLASSDQVQPDSFTVRYIQP